MSLKKKKYTPSDDDFDVLYLDDDNNDIEEWVDNEEKAEIDWSDDDGIQIGRLDDEDELEYKSSPMQKKQRSKKAKKSKKSSSGESIAKTGGKAVKNSGKAVHTAAKGVFKVLQVCAHLITLTLIVFIMYQVGISFWNNYTAWGDLNTMISERNYTLAGFLAVGAFLLVYELIMFFWALSKRSVRKYSTNGRQDTGRGLFSFLFIGVLVTLASYFNGYIPESHNVLIGLKEGTILFGSLFMTLLPVCVAGVVCCLIRKFTDR